MEDFISSLCPFIIDLTILMGLGNLPGGVSPDDLNKLTKNGEIMDIVSNPKLQVQWLLKEGGRMVE